METHKKKKTYVTSCFEAIKTKKKMNVACATAIIDLVVSAFLCAQKLIRVVSYSLCSDEKLYHLFMETNDQNRLFDY